MKKALLLLLLAVPVLELRAATRVIVEFHGTPSAIAGRAAFAAQKETHERFRRDLASLRRDTTTNSVREEAPSIRREYSVVFSGAAVEAAPADVAQIRRLPYVRAVHPNREVRAQSVSTSVANEIVDARARVNATVFTSGGKGTTIAIIDTGIDYLHADLGNGFGPGFKVAGGYDFVSDDADPMDDHGHGTHVAGIAAANGNALIGVAPEATLIAFKALGATGSGLEDDVIAALERSADPNGDGDPSDHYDVANLSLAAPGHADDALSRAADNAVAAGVVVVAGASNEGHAIVSIGSPGNSRRAITVGAHNSAGVVADFSSRGPTPGLLTYKPDVVAPGVAISSANAGGGLITHGGTSMATPHVAGLAALLLSIHPAWSPDLVKGALVSSALPVEATPFLRGAGRVDGQRAHDAAVFLAGDGVSFGLAPSLTGTQEIARTFEILNWSSADVSLALASISAPSGATVTIAPQSFSLKAGESRTIEARLVIDNAALPIDDDPDKRLLGGDIVFNGLTVPWAVLRSGRLRVESEAPVAFVEAFPADGFSRFFRSYSSTKAELFVKPGGVWDFVASSFDVSEETEKLWLTFVENRTVGTDELIVLRSSDAPLRIAFDGRDAAGVPLSARQSGPHTLRGTTVTWRRDAQIGEHANAYPFTKLTEVFVSPMSSRFSLTALETVIDLDAMDAYTVQHETLRGITESKTLTRDASSMVHAVLELEPIGTSLSVCNANGDFRLAGSSFRTGRCVQRSGTPEGVLDYYTTRNENPLVWPGIQVRTSHLTTPPFHEYEGDIVATWDATPSAAAVRVPNGDTVAIGRGPVFPYALPGTTGGVSPFRPRPGFFGPVDEDRGTGGMYVSGEPGPGKHYTVARDNLSAAGHVSRGVLDVTFGSDESDQEPPTLTSLRILDRDGRNADRLTRRQSATLHFSAADLDYRKATETKLTRAESTQAWVRQTGTANWIPLSLIFGGSETGNANGLRHVPAGDLYRADLSSVTSGGDALYDLRIDLEDAAGNRATWTQSPAFSVGTVAAPPRRRSVR